MKTRFTGYSLPSGLCLPSLHFFRFAFQTRALWPIFALRSGLKTAAADCLAADGGPGRGHLFATVFYRRPQERSGRGFLCDLERTLCVSRFYIPMFATG